MNSVGLEDWTDPTAGGPIKLEGSDLSRKTQNVYIHYTKYLDTVGQGRESSTSRERPSERQDLGFLICQTGHQPSPLGTCGSLDTTQLRPKASTGGPGLQQGGYTRLPARRQTVLPYQTGDSAGWAQARPHSQPLPRRAAAGPMGPPRTQRGRERLLDFSGGTGSWRPSQVSPGGTASPQRVALLLREGSPPRARTFV